MRGAIICLSACVACVASVACVPRVDTTRVTLVDPAELVVAGSGSLPGSGAIGLVDHDVVLLGAPEQVLAFDGDELHMHLLASSARHAKARPLDLRLDTPLANVTSVRAVGVVTSHSFIPLGLVAGGLLIAMGGGMLAFDDYEHVHNAAEGPAIGIALGVAILALEIHARLARDTVTVIRGPARYSVRSTAAPRDPRRPCRRPGGRPGAAASRRADRAPRSAAAPPRRPTSDSRAVCSAAA